jgi:hypothetical protein
MGVWLVHDPDVVTAIRPAVPHPDDKGVVQLARAVLLPMANMDVHDLMERPDLDQRPVRVADHARPINRIRPRIADLLQIHDHSPFWPPVFRSAKPQDTTQRKPLKTNDFHAEALFWPPI